MKALGVNKNIIKYHLKKMSLELEVVRDGRYVRYAPARR